MTGFNLLDIVFAILLCVFIFRGINSGIIREVGMIAALVLGLLCAYLFFQPVAELFISWGLKFAAPVAAFIAVFAVTYLIVTIVTHFLKTLIDKIQLGSLDRIFGAALGFLEGFIIVYVLMVLITLQPFQGPKEMLDSSLAKNIVDNNLYSLTAYLDEAYRRLVETVSDAVAEKPADV